MGLTIGAAAVDATGTGVSLAIDAALQSQVATAAEANVAALFGSVGLGSTTDALA